MNIEYKTEGKALLDGDDGLTGTSALLWMKGGNHVRLMSGDRVIELTRKQLLELGQLAPTIAADLVGDEA